MELTGDTPWDDSYWDQAGYDKCVKLADVSLNDATVSLQNLAPGKVFFI
jgi:hypothetical protein